MLNLSTKVRVFLYRAATDMRKGFCGLHGIVLESLKEDPLSGDLFVFINRRRDRIKILQWEGDGLAIYYKRLESGTFAVPDAQQDCYRIEQRSIAVNTQWH